MATVRHAGHKLISLNGFGESVYKLSDGMIDEGTNLAANTAPTPLQDSLRMALQSWESELMDPIWEEPKNWNKVTRHIYERLLRNEPVLYKSPGQMKSRQ